MIKRLIARASPRRSAIMFQAERPNLINQQDEWLDWDGNCYVAVEEATLDSEISEWCDNSFQEVEDTKTGKRIARAFNPKPSDVWAIRDSLKKMVHKPASAFAAPCWLDSKDKTRPKARDLISVKNGLLDITTLRLYKASPLFFNRTSLPIDYDANAPKPALWAKFLGEVFSERPALTDLLQEAFGYTLSDDTSQHAIFHLWGVARAGKSTILHVLTDLVGEDNTHSPSIMELSGTFGLQGCLAKSLLTITDMDVDERARLSAAAVRLNAISGEDRVSIERKGITPWGGRLPGRLWLASNNLPDFGSHATALAARLIIFPFDVSFLGREDRDLTNKDGTGKLQRELSGILNWSLAGLARLRERGRFAEPVESKEAKFRMLYASEPVRGFVEEKCVLDPDGAVDKATLYELYKNYCQTIGTHPLAMPKFAERLHYLFPSIAPRKRSIDRGSSRVPIFGGVRLNDRETLKVFKTDPEIVALGLCLVTDALILDEDQWPIRQHNSDFAD